MCTVSGWGNTQNSTQGRDVLRAVNVHIIDNETCAKAYSNYNVDDSMVCAGVDGGGKDACQGDSGGPMTCECGANGKDMCLMGTVSWGIGCAQAAYPGVYGRITYVHDWFEDKTKGGCCC